MRNKLILILLLIFLVVACAQKEYSVYREPQASQVQSQAKQPVIEEKVQVVQEKVEMVQQNVSVSKENSIESDIIPGKGSGILGKRSEGAESQRILEAVSKDGLYWRKTGFILSDQASSPGTVLDKEGRLRVYYEDAKNGGISVAIKDNNRWYYKKVYVAGSAKDPEIILLTNGSYRMYYNAAPFTLSPSERYDVEYKINSAISTDGINFYEEGKRYVENTPIENPDVFFIEGTYNMLVTIDEKIDVLKSIDGLTWGKFGISIDDCVQGSVVKGGGGFRLYCQQSIDGKKKIVSFFSGNGGKWQKENIRLEVDSPLEAISVGNPGVERMLDGTYVIYYTAYIN